LRLWLGLGFVFYVYFVSTVAIRKAWATCTQSFAPWQQATIYSSSHGCHDHSIIAFLHHIYIYCCSSCTSRLWWITHSTPPERLQHYQALAYCTLVVHYRTVTSQVAY